MTDQRELLARALMAPAAAPVQRRAYDVAPAPYIPPGAAVVQRQSDNYPLDPVDNTSMLARLLLDAGAAPQTEGDTARQERMAWNAGEGFAGSASPGRGIRAFHGSPHSFERFDMSRIGTGEGAQSYGHGLYFAQSEDVARHYRDIVPASGRAPAEGAMYEVNLNVDPRRLLDWDTPLSAQPQAVREAIAPRMEQYHRDVARSYIAPQDGWGELATAEAAPTLDDLYRQMTGQRFYREIAREANSPDGASALLREAGIPGMQHLDGHSRAAGTGTSNFVMFDDSLIEIMRKYGVGGLGVGTAGAAATND